MKKVEMFVITHREPFIKLPPNYKVIGVGEYGKENANVMLSDATGDHISFKNPHYCELTAIYWLWKNYPLSDLDYIGICHYRRYFVSGIFSTIYKTGKIEKIMKNWDVILPHKVKEKPDVWQYFANSISGREKDLITLQELIKNNYSDYYPAFQQVMHAKAASFCNMAVMTKKDFCDYCTWLFELLQEYEKFVDLTGYTRQEQRIYGFMSEFLLNVWVLKQKKKVKYVNTMLFTNRFQNMLKRGKILLNQLKRGIKNYDKS